MRTYLVLISNDKGTRWRIFWTFKGAITCAIMLKDRYDIVEVVNRHNGKTIFKMEEGIESWGI